MHEEQRSFEKHVVLFCVVVTAVLTRSYHVTKVFRGDDVVLVSVDPWRYRFRLDRLTERAQGPLDFATFVDPGRDDLMVATLGWIAELFGGGSYVTGFVLAVYPVVVAVVMCLLAYLVGTWVTDDRWVGFSAAGVLALTPAHVYRTALGFGDHHAFDYLWLAITIVTIVCLIRETGSTRERWLATTVLGVALAAQALSWIGGVLLIAPYGGFVALLVLSTSRSDDSTASVLAPFVIASGIATVLTAIAVTFLSWQSVETVAILGGQTFSLGLLLGISALGERMDWSAWTTWGGITGVVIAAALMLSTQRPTVTDGIDEGLEYFSSTTGTVAEATSLLGGSDPTSAVLSFLGLFVLLFAPYVLVVTWRSLRRHNPEWLAVTTYAWYFFGLSGVQRRFAGELSLFFAIVVGFAIVDLLRRVTRIQESGEKKNEAGGNAGASAKPWFSNPTVLFVVVTTGVVLLSVTAAQVPLTMENRTVTDAEYETAQEIREYANERGWERSEGYVFSSVRSNLMYNYYAHGEEVSFFYAQQNYIEFLAAIAEREWHHELERRGTGFVVVSDRNRVGNDVSMHTRLYQNLGSARGAVDGVGQFRQVYKSEDNAVVVYTPVEGALLSSAAPPNETVNVTAAVTVADEQIDYQRRPVATRTGKVGIFVPYAGTYRVGDQFVQVNESDVRQGKTVGQQGETGHWGFDERRGEILFDQDGGNHGVANDVAWTQGVSGSALSLNEESQAAVEDTSGLNTSRALTVSVWIRTSKEVDYRTSREFSRLVAAAPTSPFRNTSGYQIALNKGEVVGIVGNGTMATVVGGSAVNDGAWHRVTLTWNGTAVSLYVDGDPRETKKTSVTPTQTNPLVFGATTENHNKFVGEIDEVIVREDAMSAVQVRRSFGSTRNATATMPRRSSRLRPMQLTTVANE